MNCIWSNAGDSLSKEPQKTNKICFITFLGVLQEHGVFLWAEIKLKNTFQLSNQLFITYTHYCQLIVHRLEQARDASHAELALFFTVKLICCNRFNGVWGSTRSVRFERISRGSLLQLICLMCTTAQCRVVDDYILPNKAAAMIINHYDAYCCCLMCKSHYS